MNSTVSDFKADSTRVGRGSQRTPDAKSLVYREL